MGFVISDGGELIADETLFDDPIKRRAILHRI
jgi:hypothetical protein